MMFSQIVLLPSFLLISQQKFDITWKTLKTKMFVIVIIASILHTQLDYHSPCALMAF